MNGDPELVAMGAVYQALDALGEDNEAKARVLGWVSSRLGLSSMQKAKQKGLLEEGRGGGDEKALAEFQSVAVLFAAAQPQSTADKCLVVGAFLQESNGGTDVTGREINAELKHLGHGVGNITKALEPLIKNKPQLLIQTRKEGTTKQAQKKYRVTAEGLKRVQLLLAGSAGNDK